MLVLVGDPLVELLIDFFEVGEGLDVSVLEGLRVAEGFVVVELVVSGSGDAFGLLAGRFALEHDVVEVIFFLN